MIYKGKIAIWYIMIVVLYNVIPLFFIGNSILVFIALLFYYLLGDAIMLPVLFRNRVEVQDDSFIVYFGFSKKQFLFKDIRQIDFTTNCISASACSLDRLYIDLKDQDIMISLVENEKFVQEVKNKNSNVKINKKI